MDVEQSTLSRYILKLERVAGVRLFDRCRAGVSTTIAGARFIRSARSIVINAEQMLASSRAAGQGRAGSLMLGLNSSVSAGNLRATMLAWARDNPNVDLDGVEAEPRALARRHFARDVEVDIFVRVAVRQHISDFRFQAGDLHFRRYRPPIDADSRIVQAFLEPGGITA